MHRAHYKHDSLIPHQFPITNLTLLICECMCSGTLGHIPRHTSLTNDNNNIIIWFNLPNFLLILHYAVGELFYACMIWMHDTFSSTRVFACACHLALFYELVGLFLTTPDLVVHISMLGLKCIPPWKTLLILWTMWTTSRSFPACYLLAGSREFLFAAREHLPVFCIL